MKKSLAFCYLDLFPFLEQNRVDVLDGQCTAGMVSIAVVAVVSGFDMFKYFCCRVTDGFTLDW